MNRSSYPYTLLIGMFILFIGINLSCRDSNSNNQVIKKQGVYLLVGEWEMKTSADLKNKSYVEKWEVYSKNELNGEAFILNKQHKREFKKADLGLYKRNDSWVYKLNNGQHNGIELHATKVEDKIIRFEQSGKNFPNYIQYTFVNKHKMEVELGSSSSNEKQAYTLVKQ